VGVWLLAVIGGFYYLVGQRLVVFDPLNSLINTPIHTMIATLNTGKNASWGVPYFIFLMHGVIVHR